MQSLSHGRRNQSSLPTVDQPSPRKNGRMRAIAKKLALCLFGRTQQGMKAVASKCVRGQRRVLHMRGNETAERMSTRDHSSVQTRAEPVKNVVTNIHIPSPLVSRLARRSSPRTGSGFSCHCLTLLGPGYACVVCPSGLEVGADENTVQTAHVSGSSECTHAPTKPQTRYAGLTSKPEPRRAL
eukprot:2683602-Rhodomonas_salina.1